MLVALGWAAGILITPISLTGLFIALGSREWGPRIQRGKQALAWVAALSFSSLHYLSWAAGGRVCM